MKKTKKVFMLLLGMVLLLSPMSSAFAAEEEADKTPPSDVENVKVVTSGEKSITLGWDTATDNVGVVSYKLYYGTSSVSNSGGKYTEEANMGNVLNYEVKGLETDTKYFFTITAVDAASNESEYYSSEVEGATTTKESEEEKATDLTINNSVALYSTVVEVTFSKEVVLPSVMAEKSFSVKEKGSGAELIIADAKIDSENSKKVILTTQEQKKDQEYILTAGVTIKDKDGNPIVSGTSDTASFTGTEKVKEEVSKETENGSPKIEKVTPNKNTEIDILFSEDVVLDEESPESHFEIFLKNEESKELEVKQVGQSKSNKRLIRLVTSLQEANADYIVKVSGLTDVEGNQINEDTDGKATYTSMQAELKDLLPPEEITNFLTKIISDTAIKLTWTASLNTAKDLVDQVLYQSEDLGKNYNNGKSLGSSITSHDVTGLTPGKTYTFKMTTKDASGNESTGVVKTIKLPTTGAGLGILALSSLITGVYISRKKKK